MHTCAFLSTLVFVTFHKEISLHLGLCMVFTVLATKAFEIHNKSTLNQSGKQKNEPPRKFIGGIFWICKPVGLYPQVLPPCQKGTIQHKSRQEQQQKKRWQRSLCCQTCILHVFHRRYSLHLLWVQALVGRGMSAAPGMSWRRHLLMDAAGLQPEVKSAGETVRFKGCSQAYLLWGKMMWLF